jgi:hypothetical protein
MAKNMSTQKLVNFSAQEMAEAAKKAGNASLPPVHLWNPPFCGDMDMHITADGSWFHEGDKINRPEMVKLFSSILRKDDDAYFLVTPVEKVGITVEDVPFVITDMTVRGSGPSQVLAFESHVGDQFELDDAHPLRIEIDPGSETPKPYVTVRSNLEGRIDRKTFYRLVDLATTVDGWFGVYSNGTFFPLIESNAL